MDLNQAMSFIRWDENRRATAAAVRKSSLLNLRKYDLSERKFAFEQMKEFQRMQEKQQEQEKYVVSSWTDSYHKAKDVGMKEAIRGTMQSYVKSLSPQSRAAIRPYLEHSPLSETERKRSEYIKLYPFPKEPSPEDYKDKNYLRIANFEFEKAAWLARERNFTAGIPIKETEFVGVAEGVAAVKDGKGQTHILTAEDMALTELAKKYDTSEGQLLASGGEVTAKEPMGSIIRGGQWIHQYSRVNAFNGKYSMLEKPGGTVPSPSSVQLPTDTRKLLNDIAGNNEDNLVAQQFRKLLLEGPEQRKFVVDQLTSTNKGFVFSVEEIESRTFWQELKFMLTRMPHLMVMGTEKAMEVGTGRPSKSVAIFSTQGSLEALEIPGFEDRLVYVDHMGIVRNRAGVTLGRSREEAAYMIGLSFKKRAERGVR